MTNEAREPNKFICIKGTSWLRVYSACQGLMSPTRFYGATHRRCREIIFQELGYCPKGKPGTEKPKLLGGSKRPSNWRDGGHEAILEWLGVVHMEQATDETLLGVNR